VATGIRASLIAARAQGVFLGRGIWARVVGPVVVARGVLALTATSSVPADRDGTALSAEGAIAGALCECR